MLAILVSTALLGAHPAAAATPATPAFSLTKVKVAPATMFIGRRDVTVRFGFTAPGRLDLRVEFVNVRTGRIAKRVVLKRRAPGRVLHVHWNGVAAGARHAAADGRYSVRVIAPSVARRRRLGTFSLRGQMYPIRGPHFDRGGIGVFGAPRNGGRTHEGFDVMSPCGTRLVAARGGVVVRSRYDPVLYGNEVIVRGVLDGRTYRYAHLRETPLVKRGQRVRTGQQLGFIGETGNAISVGCHLHFELRDHRGNLLDPAPFLHAWDRFS